MKDWFGRRDFLTRMWQLGGALVAAAGAWTTWDVLRPRLGAGFGGVVRTVPETSVTADGVQEVLAARSYLTRNAAGEVIALSEKCPHLGCRVPWCESSGQFECPCHGSVFNRVGEWREGPSPRGMDYYVATVVDGIVEVDTGEVITGASTGTETIDEPVRGPSCEESTHA